MVPRTLKEVSAPYTVSAEDESIGRETVIVHRDGKPVAVVLPFEEYEELLARQPAASPVVEPLFERERSAFQRLLLELLTTHRGEWVAIVDGQQVEFGPDFSSVIVPVRQRFGQRPVYIHEISEQAHTYRISSPRLIRP